MLLDIGVGPSANIAARDFNCQVTNIDISEKALKEAKAEVSAEVRRKIKFEEVHSKDPYQVVNLSWLEKKLSGLGKVEKYRGGEERTVFVIRKY